MLDLTCVGHAHRRGKWLFRDLSHTVRPGEVSAVLGPNGRGKSTLLRCAAGLLQPTAGTVRGSAQTAYVPQDNHAAFAYRAMDMVLMGRARHVTPFSMPTKADEDVAWAALDRVGIGHLGERAFDRLSGGERQLVLIARALASHSPVLLLDEPCSALDVRNQGVVLALLRQLAAEGMGIVVTTHDPNHARDIADYAILMGSSAKVVVGTVAEAMQDALLSEFYGVGVKTVPYSDGTRTRQVIATWHHESNEPPHHGAKQ